jgi:hypothetical protein
MLERAFELRDRDLIRVVPPARGTERPNYIAPPPGVRFRNRWPG